LIDIPKYYTVCTPCGQKKEKFDMNIEFTFLTNEREAHQRLMAAADAIEIKDSIQIGGDLHLRQFVKLELLRDESWGVKITPEVEAFGGKVYHPPTDNNFLQEDLYEKMLLSPEEGMNLKHSAWEGMSRQAILTWVANTYKMGGDPISLLKKKLTLAGVRCRVYDGFESIVIDLR